MSRHWRIFWLFRVLLLPEVGGIQEYAYNRCLQRLKQVIVLTAACAGVDQAQPFN